LFFDWQIRSHAQKHFIAEAKVTLIRSPTLLMLTLTPTQGKDMKFYARKFEPGDEVSTEFLSVYLKVNGKRAYVGGENSVFSASVVTPLMITMSHPTL
jgi:hypothetical protein